MVVKSLVFGNSNMRVAGYKAGGRSARANLIMLAMRYIQEWSR